MIHIISISDGHKHFAEAISPYIDRMEKNVRIHTIKPVKHTDIAYIKKIETQKLIEKLQKLPGKYILCDERGKDMDSIGFSRMISTTRDMGEDLVFIIGGSYGVDISLLEDDVPCTLLRISHFVVPHGLAFLILIEQIYRAHEILRGSGYHHQ